MECVVVERTFDTPVNVADLLDSEQRQAWCFNMHRVTFLRSFLSPDGKRMICLFEAPDAEAVRIANRQAGVPFDRVWTAAIVEPETAPETTPETT